MANPIKEQALKVLRVAGIDANNINYEKVIIEITASGSVDIRIDFKRNNKQRLKVE
jgi:hypothetical protein